MYLILGCWAIATMPCRINNCSGANLVLFLSLYDIGVLMSKDNLILYRKVLHRYYLHLPLSRMSFTQALLDSLHDYFLCTSISFTSRMTAQITARVSKFENGDYFLAVHSLKNLQRLLFNYVHHPYQIMG